MFNIVLGFPFETFQVFFFFVSGTQSFLYNQLRADIAAKLPSHTMLLLSYFRTFVPVPSSSCMQTISLPAALSFEDG